MSSTNPTIRFWISRTISITIILCLLLVSTPAAPQMILAVAKDRQVGLTFWLYSSGLAKWLQRNGGASSRVQEKQRDRDAKINRIQIFPGNVTIDVSDHVRFSAIAYGLDDNPIGGVKARWRAQNSLSGRRSRISQYGEFEATGPGTFTVTAEINGKTAQVAVEVRQAPKRDLTLRPISTRHVSTRDVPSASVASNREASATKSVIESPRNKLRGNGRVSIRKRSHSDGKTTSEPLPVLPSADWDDTNFWSADDPGNGVGNPPGAPLDGGAGSGNFQFAAPIYSAPGRGINISLGAAYNSRLWNKAGTQITYDIDRGWPAPGFNLGFGKMLGMGVYNGAMLVDADGTRHGYTGTITSYGWGTYGVMHTTDGSFIDYTYYTGTGGSMTGGEAKLPNGTIINFGASSGHLYPTSIEDANGNYITITYVNNIGPRIQTVNDTLNRTINFHYDTNNLLTAVTAPGLDGATRTLVRFHYDHLALNCVNAFSGLTPSVRDPNPWVVDAIYYPATSTGYWLNVSDSYSTYGMLAKVVDQRNMGFSAASLDDMGSVSQGTTTRSETYDYPLTPDSSLTDAPTYTTMTESWTRDGTNVDSATTGYLVAENATNPDQPTIPSRKVEVTLPNQTKSVQYSYNYTSLPDNDPRKALDGLVYQDQTLDSAGTVLQGSTATWEKGAYDAPRPLRVEKTNENQQMTAADFIYGSVHNQVTEVRDYDYGGALLRSTNTTYQNSVDYTGTLYGTGFVGRHIFNLPLSVGVYANDNTTRVSRTEYQYDGQTLSPAPNVVQHNQASNPYAEAEGFCYTEPDQNDPDCTGTCSPETPCDGNCPDIYYCPYISATDYRGNVTQVTTFTNAASEPASGPITETRTYDVTGNLVTASTACCEQATIQYTVDTQYAYPEKKTRGAATDPYAQVTTSATYDFYTGLILSSKDANGRLASTDYDPDTLRPTTTILPTGAHTDYAYDDIGMTVSARTYLAPGVNSAIADENVKYLNGRGQVRQEKARGPDNGQSQTWDAVDTIFNNLGQVSQQSAAYRIGSETPVFSTAIYDALGRTTRVTAPDGSVNETYYNERDFDANDSYVPQRPNVASNSPGETTLVRDAWGRERWGRTDASGRLVEVVEPNPSGTGSVATGGLVTTYVYNTLGNLTEIHQDAQTRLFNYDSLGRLTAQKLAEMNGTLNDSGVYQTSGGTWSDVFTYDERSNLTSRTDARGVKTVYNYNNDPLNRLQTVSWDTSNFGDTSNPIVPAGAVTYQYRQKGNPLDKIDITQVEMVSTAAVSVSGYSTSGNTETFHFDSEGRVDSKTLTFNNRTNYPFAVNYTFDALDRVENVTYPSEYLNGTQPRKVVHHEYDNASRLSSLTYDGQSFASNIVYNAASQTTSLKIGVAGANQITENYSYNAQTGLLDNQTVVRGTDTAHPLLDLSYDYTNASGKRTGQLAKILNNRNHQKDRGYSYDALGRLVQATGGPSAAVLWIQTYSYDRYGNRLTVSANGQSAKLDDKLKLVKPSDPKVDLPTDLLAKNDLNSAALSGNSTARDSSEPVSDSPSTLRRASADNRVRSTGNPAVPDAPPTFTDDPLTAGVTTIQGVHITELRDAINGLRLRAGLGTATWAESITSGVTIKFSHITEMRTGLEEARAALGLSPTTYTDPGLSAGYTIKVAHIQELRDSLKAAWNTSSQIPRDGHASLSYDVAGNRITTSGFEYDKAGNQVRALVPGGTGSQRFRYDAANRLVQVRTDDNNTVIASYTYGNSNERLIAEEGTLRTYYFGGGGTTIAEYSEMGGSTTPAWSKSYVYLGSRLLSTLTPNVSGGESIEYHHPDRLGTRLVTNAQDTSFSEQVTLPFGTALGAESSGTPSNRRFTSYDRSDTTKLDYAVNRHYDPQQGRFTQVDPIRMKSVDLTSPQTLNLYAYCTNDPINHTDPTGLGFFSFLKKAFNFIKSAIKWIIVALTVAIAVVAVVFFPVIAVFTSTLTAWLGTIGSVAGAAGSLLGALGLNKAAGIFGIISAGIGFLSSLVNLYSVLGMLHPVANQVRQAVLSAISQGATLASRILSATGHRLASQWLGLASTVTGFISAGYKKAQQFKWHPTNWEIINFARSSAQQGATLAGATKLADILDVAGIVQDFRTLRQASRDLWKVPPDEAEWNGNPHYQLTDRDQVHWFIYNVLVTTKTGIVAWQSIIRRTEKGVALARP